MCIDNQYGRVRIPDKIKNMNVEVIILMSEVNETRFLFQYESCECQCGLNGSVCNSKQKWNYEEWWCEPKELDNWSSYNMIICRILVSGIVTFLKSCKIDKYLDLKNCSFGKCLYSIQLKTHLLIKK